MKAATYITQIRQQVAVAHGGEIPKGLDLTIRRYAKAAVKTDDPSAKQATSSLDEFIDGIKG